MKTKPDFRSVMFRLWGSFIIFSAILIGLIWLLQIFFLDAYYEEMKMRETKKMASELVSDFRKNPNMDDLRLKVDNLSLESDVYIRVESGDGTDIWATSRRGPFESIMYNQQITVLRERLKKGRFKDISTITPESHDTRTLAYACYLYNADGGKTFENMNNSCILYIFSPLYPVKTTISILRVQLVYITIIAMLMAISLALYISTRISKPIKKITEEAAELGRGNYGITFQGGKFSEIEELASTLNRTSQELEKTDMYQKDLIANVSHDLRTPLTMIRSYAEMIRDLSGDNPKKRNQHLKVIIEESDRLNTLVNDMLDMSRMQSGKTELNSKKFNLTETLKTVLDSFKVLSEKDGYEFIFKCTQSFIVYGDEAKIRQVLSNLIGNAVKYCGEDKKIIIRLKRNGRNAICEIEDHGQGIAEDEIPRVWDKYYKSSTHHVRPAEGTGLGLSIVKEILILHNADFGVKSKKGKGSIFWFSLPYVKQPTKFSIKPTSK